jgi:hypothetical protein
MADPGTNEQGQAWGRGIFGVGPSVHGIFALNIKGLIKRENVLLFGATLGQFDQPWDGLKAIPPLAPSLLTHLAMHRSRFLGYKVKQLRYLKYC